MSGESVPGALTPEDRARAVMRCLDLAEQAMKHAQAAQMGRFGFQEVAQAAFQAAADIADAGDKP